LPPPSDVIALGMLSQGCGWLDRVLAETSPEPNQANQSALWRCHDRRASREYADGERTGRRGAATWWSSWQNRWRIGYSGSLTASSHW
jgi:hypothetical protein